MKKLLMLLVMMLAACSAAPGEDLGETSQALCSGPPIATGTVGAMVTTPYISTVLPWTGPPAEAYSAKVFLSTGGTGKVSWGAPSGTTYRVAGCVGFDGPCVVPPAGPITTLKLFSGTNDDGTLFVSFYINGSKASELVGANAATSLQNTKTYSSGIARIRQDTGANSRFYFEGYNAGVWTSWSAKFFNSCGSIN
jgi:hypothetical protein